MLLPKMWLALSTVQRQWQTMINFETLVILHVESRAALVWSDGFAIDFALKKSADCWLRRWVICTANIATDKVLFRIASRLYIDHGLVPAQNESSMTGGSTAVMLGQVGSVVCGVLWLWYALTL